MRPVIHNKAELAVPKQLSVPRVGHIWMPVLVDAPRPRLSTPKPSFELIEHVAASASRHVLSLSRGVSSSSGRLFDLRWHCRGGAPEFVSFNLVQSIRHLCPRLFNPALLRKYQNGVDIFGAPFFPLPSVKEAV